ncbi:Zinc finger protein 511 [Frankliniella fusca]|uniref:Zinc finger protein 511 n=1 Tax=Frankliniella fusca TaxID=407009 RepID=A0AAE1H5G9_9NEOP|nr:Zinc finger protein 511 [Frankliniella fusca]
MSSSLSNESMKGGRRLPDDPFFEEGDKVCNMFKRLGVFDLDSEELCHNQLTNLVCEVPGCGIELQSVMELELHYNSVHRYTCATCRKAFASAHLLDLHIEETHDSFFAVQAERKPMYRCLIERCSSKFSTSQERHGHCVDCHSFPPKFRWFTPKVSKSNSTSNCIAYKAKEINRVPVVSRDKGNGEMDVDNSVERKKCEVNTKKPVRSITFGRGQVKKSFKSYGTDWHRKVEKVHESSALEDTELSKDLMDTLPTL